MISIFKEHSKFVAGPNLDRTSVFPGQIEIGPDVIGPVSGPQNLKIWSSGPGLDRCTPLIGTVNCEVIEFED